MVTAPTDLAALVGDVPDPELPMVTIGDLGIVKSVATSDDAVVVELTPTYLGCPALVTIEEAVRDVLHRHGWVDVTVCTVLDPPWSTDRITARGRRALLDAGIALPAVVGAGADGVTVAVASPVECPRCGSRRTRRLGHFGSTACKAPFRCDACGEPFEQVKPL